MCVCNMESSYFIIVVEVLYILLLKGKLVILVTAGKRSHEPEQEEQIHST